MAGPPASPATFCVPAKQDAGHPRFFAAATKDVDARVKPGHDDIE
jgi:hypothetical protein